MMKKLQKQNNEKSESLHTHTHTNHWLPQVGYEALESKQLPLIIIEIQSRFPILYGMSFYP